MCVTDRHNMTLAIKVALNLNTTNQPTNQKILSDVPVLKVPKYMYMKSISTDIWPVNLIKATVPVTSRSS